MIEEVKQILWDIITIGESGDEEDQDQSIQAVQQLGISITNAVAKHGVNVIQLQSIVQKKVLNKVVKCLKLIDEREHEYIHPQIPAEHRVPLVVNTEQPITPDEAFRDFVRAEINDEVPVEAFVYRVLQLYTTYAIERYGDTSIAAKKIGMPLKQFLSLREAKQN